MNAADKIEYIAKQIQACEQGRQNVINCPYCSAQNEPDQAFCCRTFTAAVLAILDQQDIQERIDHARRIADHVN